MPILDLLQVTPRLWKAAYLFYPEHAQSAVDFVRVRVSRMLKGEVRSVIRGLRWMGTTARRRGKRYVVAVREDFTVARGRTGSYPTQQVDALLRT